MKIEIIVIIIFYFRSGHVFYPLDERSSELGWAKYRTGGLVSTKSGLDDVDLVSTRSGLDDVDLVSTRSGLDDVDRSMIGLEKVDSAKEELVSQVILNTQFKNVKQEVTQITNRYSQSSTSSDRVVKSSKYKDKDQKANYLKEVEDQPATITNCGLIMSYKEINSTSQLILRLLQFTLLN